MALDERTLVVRNLSPLVTRQLLHELFIQSGPVVNVVHRNDWAYIEFEHKVSVGYALALLEGIHLFGCELVLEPRVRQASYYDLVRDLHHFNDLMSRNRNHFLHLMQNTRQ